MSSSGVETVPQDWDDARDGVFFRITAGLLAADYCLGAGVLLASYDDGPGALTPPGGVRAGA